MASLKELTKAQKCAAYIFLEEFIKTIPNGGPLWIDPLAFHARYGVGKIDIDAFRKSIENEDKFSYVIGMLKEANNQRLFMLLLDTCYNLLQTVIPYIGTDWYAEEYAKMRELFKKEFDYDRLPTSECFI